VPTVRLGINRFADTDGDGVFDTSASRGVGPRRSYTIFDTAGCSCEQIVEVLHLGNGHTKFGCSIGAMDDWLAYLEASGLRYHPVDQIGGSTVPANGCSIGGAADGALPSFCVLLVGSLGLSLRRRRRRR
jgi:hypothetical protein